MMPTRNTESPFPWLYPGIDLPTYYEDIYRMEDSKGANAGSVGTFAQTLIDEDRFFYETFPDARPDSYQDALTFSDASGCSIVSPTSPLCDTLSSSIESPTETSFVIASPSGGTPIEKNHQLATERWVKSQQTTAVSLSDGNIDMHRSRSAHFQTPDPTCRPALQDNEQRQSPTASAQSYRGILSYDSPDSSYLLIESDVFPQSLPTLCASEPSTRSESQNSLSDEINTQTEIPGDATVDVSVKGKPSARTPEERTAPLTLIGRRQFQHLTVLLPSPHSDCHRGGVESPLSRMSSFCEGAASVMRISPLPSKREVQKKPPLACLFCRGRKIACGPPVPGSSDNTCNQCQRRSLKCVFPTECHRRGARKKKAASTDGMPASAKRRKISLTSKRRNASRATKTDPQLKAEP